MRLGYRSVAHLFLLPLDRATRQTPDPFFRWFIRRAWPVRRRCVGYVEPGDDAVDNGPFAADHNPIGAMGAAQHQRGQWIAMAEKAQLVELEQRKIGGLPDRDLAEFGTADAGSRPLGRPAQRVLVTHAGHAIARPLNRNAARSGTCDAASRDRSLSHLGGPVVSPPHFCCPRQGGAQATRAESAQTDQDGTTHPGN